VNSFSEKLSAVERRAWKSFVSVVEGFLGNHKADTFREIVNKLVDAYEMGCKMSLKLNVLHSHIDEFKDNMGGLVTQKNKVKGFTKISNHLRNTIKASTMKI